MNSNKNVDLFALSFKPQKINSRIKIQNKSYNCFLCKFYMKKSITLAIILISAILLLAIYLSVIRSPLTGNQILSIEKINPTKITFQNGEFSTMQVNSKIGDNILFQNEGNKEEILFIFSPTNMTKYNILPKNMIYFTISEKGEYNYLLASNLENSGKIIVE